LIHFVGTLRTGYPAYKHQVKTTAPASRLGVAPGLPYVPVAPAPTSRLGAATCPRGSGNRLLARGRSGTAMCHLDSSTHHLAHGSSGVATCPEDEFCRPQANKQISTDDLTIMISIGRVHAYLLRHCAARAALHARKACSRWLIKCR
jgi:hypothetical protein